VQASSNSNSDQLATSNQQTATAAAVSVVVQTHNRKICSGMLQYFSRVASNLRVSSSCPPPAAFLIASHGHKN